MHLIDLLMASKRLLSCRHTRADETVEIKGGFISYKLHRLSYRRVVKHCKALLWSDRRAEVLII